MGGVKGCGAAVLTCDFSTKVHSLYRRKPGGAASSEKLCLSCLARAGCRTSGSGGFGATGLGAGRNSIWNMGWSLLPIASFQGLQGLMLKSGGFKAISCVDYKRP